MDESNAAIGVAVLASVYHLIDSVIIENSKLPRQAQDTQQSDFLEQYFTPDALKRGIQAISSENPYVQAMGQYILFVFKRLSEQWKNPHEEESAICNLLVTTIQNREDVGSE